MVCKFLRQRKFENLTCFRLYSGYYSNVEWFVSSYVRESLKISHVSDCIQDIYSNVEWFVSSYVRESLKISHVSDCIQDIIAM